MARDGRLGWIVDTDGDVLCGGSSDEWTVGLMSLMLRPGLIRSFPADKANVTGEAHTSVVVSCRRLVIEAGASHNFWLRPPKNNANNLMVKD